MQDRRQDILVCTHVTVTVSFNPVSFGPGAGEASRGHEPDTEDREQVVCPPSVGPDRDMVAQSSSCRLVVERPVYQHSGLHDAFFSRDPQPATATSRLLHAACECSPKHTLVGMVPAVTWLADYSWKDDLVKDIVSGCTVAIMNIPQGMAYALLGNVPPVVGIYMAIFPVLVYAFLGTSRHVAMGSFAVICLMTGKVVSELSGGGPPAPMFNSTSPTNTSLPVYSPLEVAVSVTFMVSIYQLLMYVFRMGIMCSLLSETLVNGFTAGAAIHVFTSQIKDLLGMDIRKHNGNFQIIYTYIEVFKNLSTINTAASIISLTTVVVLILDNKFVKLTCLQMPEYLVIAVGEPKVGDSCARRTDSCHQFIAKTDRQMDGLFFGPKINTVPRDTYVPSFKTLGSFYQEFIAKTDRQIDGLLFGPEINTVPRDTYVPSFKTLGSFYQEFIAKTDRQMDGLFFGPKINTVPRDTYVPSFKTLGSFYQEFIAKTNRQMDGLFFGPKINTVPRDTYVPSFKTLRSFYQEFIAKTDRQMDGLFFGPKINTVPRDTYVPSFKTLGSFYQEFIAKTDRQIDGLLFGPEINTVPRDTYVPSFKTLGSFYQEFIAKTNRQMDGLFFGPKINTVPRDTYVPSFKTLGSFYQEFIAKTDRQMDGLLFGPEINTVPRDTYVPSFKTLRSFYQEFIAKTDRQTDGLSWP
ncbi:hypothetical protein J6590_074177 [Homalodisca vitripennis]|nr:hypothetical protein J6590_074177 [Homalodisca vitripennis]